MELVNTIDITGRVIFNLPFFNRYVSLALKELIAMVPSTILKDSWIMKLNVASYIRFFPMVHKTFSYHFRYMAPGVGFEPTRPLQSQAN